MIERKICLATESILPSEKEQLTFLSVPPKKSDDATDEGAYYLRKMSIFNLNTLAFNKI